LCIIYASSPSPRERQAIPPSPRPVQNYIGTIAITIILKIAPPALAAGTKSVNIASSNDVPFNIDNGSNMSHPPFYKRFIGTSYGLKDNIFF